MSADEKKAKNAAYMREWSRGNKKYTTYRREYYVKNCERIKELQNERLNKLRQNPEWVEKERIRKQEWAIRKRAEMGEEAFKEYQRTRNAKYRSPDKRRDMHLKAKFGLTQEGWDALFQSQNNSCAICGTTDPQSKYGWHTDHCHTTGKVRGILCNHCNRLLGGARDNPSNLEKAISYLSSS